MPPRLSPKALIFLACALALGAALALGRGQDREKRAAAPEAVRPVKLFTLQGGAGAGRSLPGTVQAQRRVDLAFRVPGQIESLPVREGQRLARGERVALLDRSDFQQAVSSLEAALSGARAALSEAELNLERTRSLYAQALVAKASLDNALSARDQARAAVGSTTAQLAQARNNLDYADLRAPFAGTVAALAVEDHQTVQAQQPVASFQDTEHLEVVIDVPEADIARVREGGRATARFEAFPGPALGLTVTEMAARADASTRTYAVTLALDADKHPALLPGMTAEVELAAAGDANPGLRIPVSALFADDAGQAHVWRFDPATGEVHRVAVEPGKLGRETIEVSGPLNPGEAIVSAGVHYLREGQKVRPLGRER
ncbi:efflux RND transporter periplasmic adaptor subunit [Desulfocurvus sp. DL9XJH121]